jgi:CHAD domain-containing protein
MLKHENGSRTGEDIEDVHDMRVAIRRMRSAIRLLKPYLRAKAIADYNRDLRRLGWTLGDVRDLDVMIVQMQAYQAGLDESGQAGIQAVIALLEERRQAARAALNAYFDTKHYRRFVRGYSGFLTQPMPEVKHTQNGSVVPYQVRHVLPMLIYDRLAAVRAYETVVEEADTPTLHALRIEFKRLRYTLSLFGDVLSPAAREFVGEIKTLQDHLGHLNDASVARTRLDGLADDLDESGEAAVAAYLGHLEAQEAAVKVHFLEAWARFNTRKVQQKLATAVLSLR